MDPQAVFKAYDIRGRTDTGEIDRELYRRVGAAFAGLTGSGRIAVGRDCRKSSEGLFEGLVDGITGTGTDVVDLGEVPTDLIYFYSGANQLPGAMITASHNPPEYNGLKLCRSGAAPVGADSGLEEIKQGVLGTSPAVIAERGTVTHVDAVDDYVHHLFSVVPPGGIGPLGVAVDGGNGMAGIALERVFGGLAAELDGLYLDPDGTFPNHPADPIQRENLEDLIQMVARGGHDIGVAFDGDADRAFFIDDEARPLSGSVVTAIIARWMLEKRPGASIVHNLITSRAVPEIILEAGGTPIRTRVGHSFIKTVMAETDAIFGGEHSGHYYFRDNYRADSGMLAMLVLLTVMTEDGRPLSELRYDVERYSASGEINFKVEDPLAEIERIAETYADADQDRLDGLTVGFGQAWFNLRPSNTEPLLRLNVEAPDAEQVAAIVKNLESIIGDAS